MSSRVQLALNVADLEASVAFYSTLFGVEVASTADVDAGAARLRGAGRAGDGACCTSTAAVAGR